MKVNKLFFVCLLLLVLTSSAVSASDNMTEDLSLDEEAIVDSSIDDANQASQIEEDVSTADDESDSVFKGFFWEDYYIDDNVYNVGSDPFATFDGENDSEIVEGEAINFIAHFPNGDEKDYDVEAYVDGNKIYIDWLSYGDEYGYSRIHLLRQPGEKQHIGSKFHCTQCTLRKNRMPAENQRHQRQRASGQHRRRQRQHHDHDDPLFHVCSLPFVC